MAKKLFLNELLKSFSPVERKEWEKAAISEINNDSPDEKLAWNGPDNINLLSYYDQTNGNVAKAPGQRPQPGAHGRAHRGLRAGCRVRLNPDPVS